MKRYWRRILLVILILPGLSMAWLTLTEDGLQWLYRQLKPHIPGQLSVESVQGRLIGPVVLSGIDFQQQGMHIRSRRLEFNWLPGRLLFGRGEVSRLHIQNLEIFLPPAEPEKQTDETPYQLPDVTLPMSFTLRDVKVEGLAIYQSGQSVRIKQLNAHLKSSFNRISIEQFELFADDYQLMLMGDVKPYGRYPHDLKVEWQARLASGDLLVGKGRIHGDIEKTEINQQLVSPSSISLHADVFKLLLQPTWRAEIEVARFDSTLWKADLAELKGTLKMQAAGDLKTATISGKLNAQRVDTGPFNAKFKLRWLEQQVLKIDALSLRVKQSETHLQAKGGWRPGDAGGEINLTMDWKNLRWPIQQDAQFSSAIGKGSLEGNLQDYRFNLQTDKFRSELPASTWTVNGEGNQNEVSFQQIQVKTLDGEIRAKGKLNWSPQLTWQVEVDARDINPVSIYPEWPGQLNISLINRGLFVDGQVSAEVDIEDLQGKLRDYPVALKSRLSWRQQGVDIKNLNFRSSASELTVNGRVDQTLDLDWSIRSGNLAELYPAAAGELHAHGELSGSRDKPVLKANLNARMISFQDYQAGLIEGEVLFNLMNPEQLEVNLSAREVGFQRFNLDSLNVLGNAKKLQITASSDSIGVDIELTGKAMEVGWKGQIQKADIDLKAFNLWRLKAPARMSVDNRSLNIEQLCWTSPVQETESASLCAKLVRSGKTWRSDLQLGRFPLPLLNPWLPRDLTVDGLVDGRAEVKLEANQLVGKVEMDLLPGAISYPLIEDERERWEYQSGKISLSLTQQGLLSNAEINLSGDESVQASFAMPGANLLALDLQRQPIQGQAKLTLNKFGFIDMMIPEVQNVQGNLAMNLSLSGLFDQPLINGQIELQHGSLSIPRMGLKISQLELKGQSDGLDKVDFTLTAVSGDGKLNVLGYTLLDKQSGWPTEMTIKGRDFEVAHIPEARIAVSPDLSIKLRQYHVEIKGEVDVPYAHMEPRDISTATQASDDVVILGQQQPPEKKWAIVSQVKLTLGERVHFFGYGLEGRLGGKLLLKDDPGLPTRASGEINIVEGRYRAYGQRLDIEQGRLLFTGGPLIKPGLDIRAVRKVNFITAGIKVRGHVDEPQIELFSTPAMGQTDILSYLLLGRPVENTSDEEGAMMAKAALALGLSGGDWLARSLRDRFGLDEMRLSSSESGDQASLVVGRYLSPRLYVSYGIGLLEAFNTVLVRYRISDQWQLKAESGEAQGADIIYTIER